MVYAGNTVQKTYGKMVTNDAHYTMVSGNEINCSKIIRFMYTKIYNK
jgi:hypothetical protein